MSFKIAYDSKFVASLYAVISFSFSFNCYITVLILGEGGLPTDQDIALFIDS